MLAKKTRDIQTGRVYNARNQAGQAVALEEFPDLDPDDPSVWYQVLRRCPARRFVDVATGRSLQWFVESNSLSFFDIK